MTELFSSAPTALKVQEMIELHYILDDPDVECHTHGLTVFGHPEFSVKHLDTYSAEHLLNFVANKVINQGMTFKPGDVIEDFAEVQITVTEGAPLMVSLTESTKCFELVYDRSHPALSEG